MAKYEKIVKDKGTILADVQAIDIKASDVEVTASSFIVVTDSVLNDTQKGLLAAYNIYTFAETDALLKGEITK